MVGRSHQGQGFTSLSILTSLKVGKFTQILEGFVCARGRRFTNVICNLTLPPAVYILALLLCRYLNLMTACHNLFISFVNMGAVHLADPVCWNEAYTIP